ncbi:MAG: PEP-CTERM sorting domain-containing protein [Cyanobacteria bacterium P01_D01_bin.156]
MKVVFGLIPASLAILGVGLLSPTAQAARINADFTTLNSGASIEGLGTVHELLNITSSTGGGKAIFAESGVSAYGASSSQTNANSKVKNGGINELGGFADLNGRKHVFDFSFAEDVSVEEFSLRMLDYGDYNKGRATDHSILLTAFNSNGDVVDEFDLSYESSNATNPNGFYKNGGKGDALMASEGDPGLATLSVFGEDITLVQLRYDNNGSRANIAGDPNIGFDSLTFETTETEDVPEPTALVGLLAIGALGLSRRSSQNA